MAEDRFDDEYPLIPKDQIDLPVTFAADGDALLTPRMLLREDIVRLPKAPEDWSSVQKTRITRVRMEAQDDFRLGFFRSGIVDKERALAEVESGSSLGATLVSIELRTVKRVLDRVDRGQQGTSEDDEPARGGGDERSAT